MQKEQKTGSGVICKIIHEELQVKKLIGCCVPRKLTELQKSGECQNQ